MRWFGRSQHASHEGERSARGPEGRDERLSAYLDGELTTAEAAGVEWEAEGDAAVRDALEGMRTVRASLGALGVEAAPRSFALPATVAAQPRRMPRLELGMRMATVAAALVTVAVFVSPSMSGSDEANEDATLTAFSSAPQQRNAAAEAPAEALQSAPAPEAAPALVPPVPGAPAGGAAADAGDAKDLGADEDAAYPPQAEGAQPGQGGTGGGAGGGANAGGDDGGGSTTANGGGEGGSRSELWSAPRVGALGLTLILGASAVGLWWRRRAPGSTRGV